MDKRTFTIGILSLTAVILFVANLLVPPQHAEASFAVKDRDYTAVTGHQQADNDVLYIVDNRTGQMAAFNYDPGRRSLMLRQVKPVQDAFAGAGNMK